MYKCEADGRFSYCDESIDYPQHNKGQYEHIMHLISGQSMA